VVDRQLSLDPFAQLAIDVRSLAVMMRDDRNRSLLERTTGCT
jgi:hypothetical protein